MARRPAWPVLAAVAAAWALAGLAAPACRFDPGGLAAAGDATPAPGQFDAGTGGPAGDDGSGVPGLPGTADAGASGPADAAPPGAPDAAVPDEPRAPDAAPGPGPACGGSGQDCCPAAPRCQSGLICLVDTCTL